MTIEEKILKSRENRSNGLTGLKGIGTAEINSIAERDFNNRFLFGDGGTGILDIFISYYIQAYQATGYLTSNPAMNSAGLYSPWTSRFNLAVSSSGDGAGGFYPPDEYGIPAQVMNTSTQWLSLNSANGELNQGIVAPIETAVDAASTALETQRNATSPIDPFPPLHPDYFNDPERTALLASITTAMNTITSYKIYIQNTIDLLNAVDAGGSPVFEEVPQMKADLPMSDIATMNTFIAAMNSHIALYQSHYDYFSSFTADDDISGQAGYNQTTFNTRAYTTLPNEVDSLQSTLASRVNSIPAVLGSTSYPFSGMRSWRYFWTAEGIGKPTGPYVAVTGLAVAKQQSQNSLNDANRALGVLFPSPTEYFKTPVLITSYFKPTFDEDGVVISGKTSSIWLGEPSANKYKIFRKDISSITLDNANWTDADLLTWWVTTNPDTGFVYTEFVDDTTVINESYVYRVQTFDTNEGTVGEDRIDTFNSSSNQSLIIDEVPSVTIVSIVEETDIDEFTVALVLTLSDSITTSEGASIAVMGGSQSGAFRVVSESDNVITIDHDDITDLVGQIVSPIYGSRFINYN